MEDKLHDKAVERDDKENLRGEDDDIVTCFLSPPNHVINALGNVSPHSNSVDNVSRSDDIFG